MKVNREYSEQNFSECGRNPIVTYYQEKEPNPLLKGIVLLTLSNTFNFQMHL